MKPIVLWFVVRLSPIWQALGADPNQLIAIVRVKLTMDNRRSYATLGRYGQGQSAEKNHQFLIILGIYILFGSAIGFSMLAIPPAEAMFVPLSIAVGYSMVFCAMTLLSDFSSLILDSADNQIVLPRPVSGRTLLLARIVHVTDYLFSIALALAMVGIVIITVRFGILAGLAYLLMSLLASVLMVFLTNVFYLLLMQLTSEERLREVINYFQIVMAILFYGSYQLLPRLMNKDTLLEPIVWQDWFYLVPPMWMGGAVDMVIQNSFDGRHLLLASLAIVMPFAGIWFMNRVLGPVFNARLAGLEQDSKPVEEETKAEQTSSMMQRMSHLLTNNPLERAAFGFTWRVTARDRKFKLKTYPQLGFGLAYIIAMSFGAGSFGKGGGFYLFALYYTGLFVMTAQYQLSASDDYKAAWVYGSAPISRPGEILSGSMKALFAKLMLPFYVLVALYITYRYGLDKIGDVLLAFSNSLTMCMISALLSERRLPFSMAQDVIKRSNTTRGLVILFMLGTIGGSNHYGLSLIPYAVWIAVPFSMGTFWYLFNRYRQTSWVQIALE